MRIILRIAAKPGTRGILPVQIGNQLFAVNVHLHCTLLFLQ